MFTKLFWKDAAERAVKTFAQTLATLFLSSSAVLNFFTIDWKQASGLGLGSAFLSLLMSIGSAKASGTDTASLTVDTKEL